MSLCTFDPNDPSLNHVVSGGKAVRNKAGLFGAYTSGILNDFFGVAAYTVPMMFLVAGGRRVLSSPPWPWWRWCGAVLMTLCVTVAGSAWGLGLFSVRGGGLLGHAVCRFSLGYFSPVGTAFVWGFLFFLSVQLVTNISWLNLFLSSMAAFGLLLKKAAHELAAGSKKERGVLDITKLPEKKTPELVVERKPLPAPIPPDSGLGFSGAMDTSPHAPNMDFLTSPGAEELQDPPWLQALEDDAITERAVRDKRGTPSRHEPSLASAPAPIPQVSSAPAAADTMKIVIHEVAKPQLADEQPRQRGDRRIPLPPLSLLHSVASSGNSTPRSVLESKGKVLMNCLADFGIQGELVGITPGPVVTMFEVRPAPGIRVTRIESLSGDLALALKAIAVRIQAPIPGTDTVGIEIPNDVRETVCLKELFSSKIFTDAESLLTMGLGKNISGLPAVADLARMPHLLVAGATGAGKSVCLNSILLSFLYKARPDEVKLLLIDPKRIELAVYADLPHLVHPVVTEMALAKNALDWAVSEMDKRYTNIARLGVRNIAAYNAKLAEFGDTRPPELGDLETMPYLVIIIDELADLMLTAAKEVETSIVRLAQLARAAGIHLILATQRPSVDVVTGLIKANFPCRISFQVTSKHDSRTILDAVGAEHLLGKGDMLFKPSGGRFQRLHGAFVGDDDVAAVADYWRKQQRPSYAVDFSEWGSNADADVGGSLGGDDVAADAMYAEATEFVRQQGKASISLIQRRFRIGFNRAARFVEQMEKDGIITPADGSKPRTVVR